VHKTFQVDIVIDAGNSGAKIALFEQGALKEFLRIKELSVHALKLLVEKHKVERGILSAVINVPPDCLPYLQSALSRFLLFDAATKIPVSVDYRTPETLGRDRIAAAVGGAFLRAGENLLIIDAGTAITLDYVTASGRFKGGNISPGVQMRFDALHTFTAHLPLIETEGETPLLGFSTETAIRSGVIRGICFEIEGYAEALRAENGQLSVFLTGGDTFHFEKRLKIPIFAAPNLVLTGLYRILLYNVE